MTKYVAVVLVVLFANFQQISAEVFGFDNSVCTYIKNSGQCTKQLLILKVKSQKYRAPRKIENGIPLINWQNPKVKPSIDRITPVIFLILYMHFLM